MAGFAPPLSPVGPGPAVHLFAITPSDTDPLPQLTRYIYVGGAGNITLIAAGDTVAVELVAVPVGAVLEICAATVKATGTSATNLVGMS